VLQTPQVGNRMDDILDSLPEVKFFRKCQKCGATNWSACNLDKDNRVVTDCNKCPDKPKDWSPLADQDTEGKK
jgi:hypothetical protein